LVPRAEVWTSENGLEWTNRTTAAAFGARSGHAVTEHAGQLWLAGGRVDETPMSDVWVSSDAVEWTRVTDDAGWSPRAEHSLVSHDDRLWVLGGTTQDPAAATDVWSSADGFAWVRETADGGFDPATNGSLLSFAGDLWLLSDSHAWWSSDGRTWTEVPATVADGYLSMYDAVNYDGRIWLYGGFDSSTSSASSEVWSSLDAITCTPESSGAAFSPLVCPQVVLHDGALFLTQGCDGGLGEIWRSADGVDWRLGNSQLVTLAPCVDGTVCTPSNVCMKGRIECNGDVPICVETGYQDTGTECGADSVCVEGDCTPPSREPALPPLSDQTFDRTWEPLLRSDCDPDTNRSPGLALAGHVLTEEGTHLAEPGVLFADETFTLVERHPAGPSSMVIGDPYVFEVFGGSPGDWEVYDDGTPRRRPSWRWAIHPCVPVIAGICLARLWWIYRQVRNLVSVS
jgi:hypothetical protein